MNYIWEPKLLPSEAIIEKLRRELHLSQTTATLLAQRGITTYDEAMQFFSPSLASLHDPFLMKDMQKAVARLSKAINTEEKILTNLRDTLKGKTVIIVSHRVSITKYADKILMLDKGRLVEQGNKEELLARNGAFKAFYDTQTI